MELIKTTLNVGIFCIFAMTSQNALGMNHAPKDCANATGIKLSPCMNPSHPDNIHSPIGGVPLNHTHSGDKSLDLLETNAPKLAMLNTSSGDDISGGNANIEQYAQNNSESNPQVSKNEEETPPKPYVKKQRYPSAPKTTFISMKKEKEKENAPSKNPDPHITFPSSLEKSPQNGCAVNKNGTEEQGGPSDNGKREGSVTASSFFCIPFNQLTTSSFFNVNRSALQMASNGNEGFLNRVFINPAGEAIGQVAGEALRGINRGSEETINNLGLQTAKLSKKTIRKIEKATNRVTTQAAQKFTTTSASNMNMFTNTAICTTAGIGSLFIVYNAIKKLMDNPFEWKYVGFAAGGLGSAYLSAQTCKRWNNQQLKTFNSKIKKINPIDLCDK